MPPVVRITVNAETELPRGWSYGVQMQHDDSSVTEHTVTLAWADHELWSGGRLAPSRVVEMILDYALEHAPNRVWPERFDCARVRRWAPRVDRDLKSGAVG